jgi:hypothetical protein
MHGAARLQRAEAGPGGVHAERGDVEERLGGESGAMADGRGGRGIPRHLHGEGGGGLSQGRESDARDERESGEPRHRETGGRPERCPDLGPATCQELDAERLEMGGLDLRGHHERRTVIHDLPDGRSEKAGSQGRPGARRRR